MERRRSVEGQDRLAQSRSQPGRSLSSPTAAGNRLLELLPPAVLARLEPHLESVDLRRKDVLFRGNEPSRACYFPVTAVISLVSTLESGESLGVGLVGRHGLAPISVFPGIFTMPCDGVVQIPGVAQRISADVLREEVLANEPLNGQLRRYAQFLLVRVVQMSVCNMFHPVDQRCIRWLLTVSDLIADGDIPVTHDLIATMLGAHRPTVTLVLRSLHKAGLVCESRGRIVIRNRRALERSCCACYRTMRNEQHRLLGY